MREQIVYSIWHRTSKEDKLIMEIKPKQPKHNTGAASDVMTAAKQILGTPPEETKVRRLVEHMKTIPAGSVLEYLEHLTALTHNIKNDSILTSSQNNHMFFISAVNDVLQRTKISPQELKQETKLKRLLAGIDADFTSSNKPAKVRPEQLHRPNQAIYEEGNHPP